VTQLFSSDELNGRKRRPPGRDRRRRRIPTGAPRLIESSTERIGRMDTEAWELLIKSVRRSAIARSELLDHRDEKDLLTCPWSRLVACDHACRCNGTGKVTVSFMRDHYARLASKIEQLVGVTPQLAPVTKVATKRRSRKPST
jgi:hypothetical protein